MTVICASCGEHLAPQGLRPHRAGRRCLVLSAVRRRRDQGLVPVPAQRGMTAALRAVGASTIEDYAKYSPGSQNRRASATTSPYTTPAAITAAQMVLREWHLAAVQRVRERVERRAHAALRENVRLAKIVGGDVGWKYLFRSPDGSLRSYWNPAWQYRAGQPVSDGQPDPDHGRGIFVCRTRRQAFSHGYRIDRVLVVGRADYTGCVDYGTKVAVREFTPIAIVKPDDMDVARAR